MAEDKSKVSAAVVLLTKVSNISTKKETNHLQHVTFRYWSHFQHDQQYCIGRVGVGNIYTEMKVGSVLRILNLSSITE